MMGRTNGRLLLLLGTGVLIAACGGGSGSSPAGGGSGPTAAPAGSEATSPTDAPAASEATAPSEAPAASADAGGGGSGVGVCELATAEEVAAAFGVAAVTSETFAGPPDTCAVSSDDGTPLASWVLTVGGGKPVYDAVVLPGQAVDVPGLGDRAAIVENTGLLIVKGEDLVTIVVSGGSDLDQDAANEVAKQIGAHIAGRM